MRKLPSLSNKECHKYQAGYVLAVAGSPGMPGAALLAGYAALKSGAGIVRLFHPCGMEAELSSAPYELIRQGWNGKDVSLIRQQAARAKVILIGPGIGRQKNAEKMVRRLIENIDLPMVIDADALFFLANHSSWSLPDNSVLTPHHGEMDQLLQETFNLGQEKKNYHEQCLDFVEKKKVTLILKKELLLCFSPRNSSSCPHKRRSWNGNGRLGRCSYRDGCCYDSTRTYI